MAEIKGFIAAGSIQAASSALEVVTGEYVAAWDCLDDDFLEECYNVSFYTLEMLWCEAALCGNLTGDERARRTAAIKKLGESLSDTALDNPLAALAHG